MKLSQRLTRAGLAFIVFGTATAMFPTNGNASAATDSCGVATQKDYVGQARGETYTGYGSTAGSLSLGVFLGSAANIPPTPAVTATNGFTAVYSTINAYGSTNGSIVTTRPSNPIPGGPAINGKTRVTVRFSDGHFVSFDVTFS